MIDSDAGFWTTYTPLGYCYSWRSDLIWVNILADIFTALSYFAVAAAVFYLIHKRPNMPYRYIAIIFATLIAICVGSHLVGVWAGLNANCSLQGLAKGMAALFGMAAGATIVPLFLKLSLIQGPKALKALNTELQNQIEEQRKSSEKLRRTEDRFRTYLQQSPDGIILVRQTGIIEYSNDTVNDMFGHPPGGLTNEYVTELMPNRFRDNITPGRNNVFDEELARSPAGSAEFIGIRKDNANEFPVEVRISPIHSEADYGELVLATLRNITDRKQREEQARQDLAELAHVSRLSTVGEMAAGLAHELNQPLTAISNNLHTAMSIQKQKPDRDPLLLEMMEENYESAQRAGKIIRGLRQLVRKDDGSKEASNINGLIQSIAKLIDPEVKAASVDLILELSDGLPMTSLDLVQAQQVMINLSRNAIEALASVDQKKRTLTISTALKDEDTIIVSVKDNGPGLPKDIRANLFQPYFTSKESGMGLGLSICRSIVEAHGGLLWLDKAYNDGTLFHFTLPTCEASK